MNTVTVYLAGPIDDVTREEAQGWRWEIAEAAPTGVLFFDPTSAWHGVSRATAQAVDYGNRAALLHSDAVLANLAGSGRAFGTVREIEFATSREKPVAVAVGREHLVSMLTYDLLVAPSPLEALDLLLEAVAKQRNQPHSMMQILGLRPPEEEQ